MATAECRWKCPSQWSEWSDWLAAGLHARSRWRLPVLLVGMLFASGRTHGTQNWHLTSFRFMQTRA